MATITVTLPEGATLSQGKQISFTAPCDSTGVTGIIINNVTYTLLKANGDSLETGAFVSGALISVLIDLTNHKAYIQNNAEVNVNADWNASSGDAQILNKPTEMTPSSHTHGNLTNDGKIGSTADLMVATTTDGALTTKTVADTKTLLGITGNTYVKLLSTTVGTEAASVSLDLSSISTIDYSSIIVDGEVFASSAAALCFRINNITGASDYYYSETRTGTTVISGTSGNSFGYIETAATDATNSIPIPIHIEISHSYKDYGSTNKFGYTSIQFRGGPQSNSYGGIASVSNNSDMSSIQIFATSGNILDKSVFRVYGVRK